ncbi:MAG: hypothetical protein JWQ48_2435 [Conexibacter sp.]|nr:hypothetical protein [Conexibacter sp.]
MRPPAEPTPVARRPRRLAELALAGYLLLLAAIAALPALSGVAAATIASHAAFSPADLAAGELWRLPLSGLVTDGVPVLQLALLAATAAPLVALAGGRAFWRAALVAHVGATLLAYALVGILELAAPASVDALADTPDYGISCVWLGALGALALTLARRCRGIGAARCVFAATSLPAIALVASNGFVERDGTLELASVEHLVAFALGVLVTLRVARSARPRTASGRGGVGAGQLGSEAVAPAAAAPATARSG